MRACKLPAQRGDEFDHGTGVLRESIFAGLFGASVRINGRSGDPRLDRKMSLLSPRNAGNLYFLNTHTQLPSVSMIYTRAR